MTKHILEKELATYEKNKEELLGRAKNKYVLIKGDKVVDVFESQVDASNAGYQRFGNVPFLVKQILEIEAPLNFTSFKIAI